MKHKKIIFFIAGLLFFSLMFFFIVQLFTARNRARTGFITSMPRSPLQIIFVTAAPHVDELLPTMLPIMATELTDSNGVAMVLIPAGEFSMGTNNGDPDEKPVATINLGAFYIDKYEVTNTFYEQCVNAGVCKPPVSKNSQTHASYYGNPDFGNYPVTYVNWYMSKNYCEWRGARLPTEAEWEEAARGTDRRTYPWGEGHSCELANYGYNTCMRDTTAVGSYEKGKSPYGVYDMAGNVLEWVNSQYKPYPYRADDGRENQNGTGPRVLRGGSWSEFEDRIRSANRFYNDPQSAQPNIGTPGFRCAKSVQ